MAGLGTPSTYLACLPWAGDRRIGSELQCPPYSTAAAAAAAAAAAVVVDGYGVAVADWQGKQRIRPAPSAADGWAGIGWPWLRWRAPPAPPWPSWRRPPRRPAAAAEVVTCVAAAAAVAAAAVVVAAVASV